MKITDKVNEFAFNRSQALNLLRCIRMIGPDMFVHLLSCNIGCSLQKCTICLVPNDVNVMSE